MEDPLKGLETFNRYRLMQPLGRGGMGVVYLAYDPKLERKVAIKCVSKNSSTSRLVTRLQQEAKLLAQLNHQNIVQLYDVIENESALGLVIEYVRGTTLLRKTQELSADLRQQLEWALQIAKGLEQAHSARIVHCDLKSENVLISDQGAIKIADFGIAKVRLKELVGNDGLTEFEKVSGSYFAMSPEQASGKRVDFKTDLFSFGILLHLLLTNRHPFGDTKNHLVMIQNICNKDFEFQAENNPNVSAELESLVSSMLQRDPALRPSSANSIANELRRELSQTSRTESARENATVLIDAPKPSASRLQRLAFKLGTVAVTVSLAVLGYLALQNEPQRIYIAALEPRIEGSDLLDAIQIENISTSIEHSMHDTLLALEEVNLVPGADLAAFDGNIDELAVSTAANMILQSDAICGKNKCDIRIQKLVNDTGGKWEVSDQRTWPSLVDSLSDVRTSTIRETRLLLAERFTSNNLPIEANISEANYRQFIELYNQSNAGSGATRDHLNRLETLQKEVPLFFSIYSLHTKVALHLYKRAGDDSFLIRLAKILSVAPDEVRELEHFQQLSFELLLAQQKLDDASQVLDQFSAISNDRVLLNEMRASLAYANNDYAEGLRMDELNTVLRPTSLRFHNLAVSQYLAGDYEAAEHATDQALALNPRFLYSLNIKAALAMLSGDIERALSSYIEIVAVSPDSENISNYGIALTLDGNFAAAIQNHRKATELNAGNPVYWLNLADALKLNTDIPQSKIAYQRVIDILSNPESAQDYGIKAQSLAHLGFYGDAIKILKSANALFPDIPELNYSAAVVHSLANNKSAAMVEFEAALEDGTGPIWFQLEWFQSLCAFPLFNQQSAKTHRPLCTTPPLAPAARSASDSPGNAYRWIYNSFAGMEIEIWII